MAACQSTVVLTETNGHSIGNGVRNNGHQIVEMKCDVSQSTPPSESAKFFTHGDMPTRVIDGLSHPWGVAVKGGMITAVEHSSHCVSLFNGASGERTKTFGKLNYPCSVALCVDGSVIVADGESHCVRKYSPSGEIITSVGTEGDQSLQFSSPCGVAVSHDSKVYVSDSDNHRVQVLNADFTFSHSFGTQGSDAGEFDDPWGITVDDSGSVYVADSGNHRIQVFSSGGKHLKTFGREGGDIGELQNPAAVCVHDGVVYIADSENHRVSMFTTDGEYLSSSGSHGQNPGQFNHPNGVAVSEDGSHLYVSDFYNNRIQIYRH